MKHTILIAEDVAINRKILCKILSQDYTVLQAENGKEALEQIERCASFLSAIILDLQMPVMNGFDVMLAMQQEERFHNIPIIVATGNNDRANELHALELGAWDFITKPYDPAILQFRLNNAIERSKLNLFEQLKQQAEIDKLTGLYNENKFCQEARLSMDAHPDTSFVIIRFDVDRFKQFNSFFGVEEGNNFLRYIASLMKEVAHMEKYRNCVYARLEADVFVICVPYIQKEDILQAIELAKQSIRDYTSRFDIVTVYGLYFVQNRNLSVSEMLDCATMAARTRKGKYLDTVAIYTDEMGKAVEQEQEIINEMNTALEEEQFLVYYQPKYNIVINRPHGAEALVRWKHPTKGLISPALFIPVFEKNGFVAKVDQFVWRKTCEYLKKWCEEGKNPTPISVNISRVNLSNPRLVDIIVGLVKEYGIEPRLLQLEITESAYMDNPESMNILVDRLHEHGFSILMDDFGSGYSSLNMLKDIRVDILKIDMNFLPKGDSDNKVKSEKILASIVRMADWIGMPVVCEGVETTEQRDFLQRVGCIFVQGYLYGKPMPVQDYEALICCTNEKAALANTELPDSDVRWKSVLEADANIQAMLDNSTHPVAIYRYQKGKSDCICVNPSFKQSFYNTSNHTNNEHMQRMAPNEEEKLDACFRQVISTRSSAECEAVFVLDSGELKWYRLNMRYLLPSQDGQLIAAIFTEITGRKQLDDEFARVAGLLNETVQIQRTMLIVDDSDVSRVLLQTIFAQEFCVLEACNGREALQILQSSQEEISIILLDMMMPVMDGAEFLREKSKLDSAAQIPVVMISAENNEHMKINMLGMGVNDYITKPFVPEVVYQRVRNVLQYQSRFHELINEYRHAVDTSALDIWNQQQNLYLDPHTGAFNRRYLEEMMFLRLNHTGLKSYAFILMGMLGMKDMNDLQIECILSDVVKVLQKQIRQSDVIVRQAKDEILIILAGCYREFVDDMIERFGCVVQEVLTQKSQISTAFGYSYADVFEPNRQQLDELLQEAETKLRVKKQ